ncbi:hypothetical protein D1007_19758 [Hordeum vulgare]|nr:hypothetical protein D1007_19758 [Hordeum vulgare]
MRYTLQLEIESPTLFDSRVTDKDTNMTDGDDADGAKENDTSFESGPTFSSQKNAQPTQSMQHSGTGTNHVVSASDLDLRFGSFQPASAPAKVCRSMHKASDLQARQSRFTGKTPRSNIGILQSTNMLQPVSLEAYLADAKLVSNRPGIMQSAMEADPERCVSGVGDAPARELGAGEVPTLNSPVPATQPALGTAPVSVGANLGIKFALAQSPIAATTMMEGGACMGGDPHGLDPSCMVAHVDHAADVSAFLMDAAERSTNAADRQVHGDAKDCTTVPRP